MAAHPSLRSRSLAAWSRVRGIGAIVTVVAFFGTAVVAPFAMETPTTAEAVFFATRDERLHQEFVADEAGTLPIDLGVSPLEEPEPEPEPEPEEEETDESDPADAQGESTAPVAEQAAPKYTGGGSPAEWMEAAGIPESDWGYVDYIASRESGWNPNATNPSSGACGIIQANPCSKVPGNGYDPVDNLTWADGYAKGRYGSWAGAYDFWTTNHWW